MLLAPQFIGLSILWFTMFDKGNIRRLLGIEGEAVPLAIVMGGRQAAKPLNAMNEVVGYIR